MPKRRDGNPISPPRAPKSHRETHGNHQANSQNQGNPHHHNGQNHGHRRQPSQPANNTGPSLQQLNVVHDAPASLEQLDALNFPAIQRFIPSLQQIALTSSYCTAYKILDDGNWGRLDIEGPLFILELNPYHPQFVLPSTPPEMQTAMGRYHAFVMNRKSPKNLLIPLPRKSENVDTTNSVLISMLMDWGDCYGLSVFNEVGTTTASDSNKVGDKILELAKEMEDEDTRIAQMPSMPVSVFAGFPSMMVGSHGGPGGGYISPSVERPPGGIDLMAALGPQIGAGTASGYASGDGGYVSSGSGIAAKGRKISLNELFGKSLGK